LGNLIARSAAYSGGNTSAHTPKAYYKRLRLIRGAGAHQRKKDWIQSL